MIRLSKNINIFILFAIHLFAFLAPNLGISSILIYCSFAYAISQLIQQKYNAFFLLLIIGSYHSNSPSVYTTDLFSLSLVYYLVFIFILITIQKFRKVPLKLFFISIIFLFIFIIGVVLGYFNKYSYYNYIVEIICFLFFFYFLFIGYRGWLFIEGIQIIKQYIQYVFPAFIIICSILKILGLNENLYGDELSLIFSAGYIPLIIWEYRNTQRLLRIIFFIVIFVFKATFFKLGSFELIAFTISTLLTLKGQFQFRKILISLSIFFIFVFLSYQFLTKHTNNYTQFKIKQIEKTAKILKGGLAKNEISEIPFSPKVRFLELFNVNYELKQSGVFYVFFGKGYGSFFTMDAFKPEDYGIPTLIGKDAYSEKEIIEGKFQSPHNSIFYIYLKGGIIGLIMLLIFGAISLSAIKNVKYGWLAIVSFPYLLINLGYGLKNYLFIGFIIGSIMFINIKKRIILL